MKKNNTLGIIAGAVGAVILSIIAAAIYDAIKGKKVFETLAVFFKSFFKLMVQKVQGVDVPVWLVLLIVLIIITVTLMIVQRASKKSKKRLVKYRVVSRTRNAR